MSKRRWLLIAPLVVLVSLSASGSQWWLGGSGSGGTGSQTPLIGNVNAAGFNISSIGTASGTTATFTGVGTFGSVASSGAVSGTSCTAAGGSNADNSLEMTTIDPGPPTKAATGTHRLVYWKPAGVTASWFDVDTTATPVERSVIFGPTSTDGTGGLGGTGNVLLMTDGTSGQQAKSAAIAVTAGTISVASVAPVSGGIEMCAIVASAALDSGTELCTANGRTCVASTAEDHGIPVAATPAVVTARACATGGFANGTLICAACN